jgi:hypothetical protein
MCVAVITSDSIKVYSGWYGKAALWQSQLAETLGVKEDGAPGGDWEDYQW